MIPTLQAWALRDRRKGDPTASVVGQIRIELACRRALLTMSAAVHQVSIFLALALGCCPEHMVLELMTAHAINIAN